MFQTIPFEQMPDNGLLRLPQVLALVPWGKSSFYEKMQKGELPRPIALGTRARAWRVGDIRQVLERLNSGEVA